jgi:hypothetical protein
VCEANHASLMHGVPCHAMSAVRRSVHMARAETKKSRDTTTCITASYQAVTPAAHAGIVHKESNICLWLQCLRHFPSCWLSSVGRGQNAWDVDHKRREHAPRF